MEPRRASHEPSCPGPTRASILPRNNSSKKMDHRVKPGDDTSKILRLAGLDPDCLDVEVLFQVLLAGLAAVAAHLVAAERHRGVHGLIAVDPDRTGAQRLGDAVRLA